MRNGFIRICSAILCLTFLASVISGCGRSNAAMQQNAMLQATVADPTNGEQLENTEIPTVGKDAEDQIAEPENEPAESEPEHPAETEPQAPSETEPTPTQPKPTEPNPTTPKPTEPESTAPKETEPSVTEPPATQPVVTEPPATNPPETEPPNTEPAEVIDLDALMQYGRSYAANTHGYEISPGLRDGYYPAYTCVFDTMEDGRTAVRGCIDDTTRALLARPGNQIVAEIDGVICRARFDISIVPKDEGTYLVNVYYG